MGVLHVAPAWLEGVSVCVRSCTAVAVAVGSQITLAPQALEKYLEHSDEFVRRAAVKALGARYGS